MSDRPAERIADEIEEAILTRRLADGARLDEARLAERFGVSRTPIREALQILGANGLVEHRLRRGAFVRGIGPVELLQMFEFMAELEASCGRLAASRMTDTALAAIARGNAGCEAAEDADAYYTANEVFHHLIYEASGNAELSTAAARMHRRLRTYRRMQLHLRGRMSESLAEHQAILAGLRGGEADAVAAMLRAHVAVQGEKFHRLLAQMR